MRILIADDEEMVRMMTMDCIRRTYPNAEIVEASTGAEALALLLQSNFDAVLTDHNMPEMTGLDFIKASHARIPTPPPILMVSGNPNVEEELTACGLPRVSFLDKPFRPVQISDFLKGVL